MVLYVSLYSITMFVKSIATTSPGTDHNDNVCDNALDTDTSSRQHLELLDRDNASSVVSDRNDALEMTRVATCNRINLDVLI